MRVTVGLVAHQSSTDIGPCLRSLDAATAGLDTVVIVVDNGSRDGTPDLVRRDHPAVRLVENPDNPGYAAGANTILRLADTPMVVIANTDLVFEPGSIARLVAALDQRPTAAWVAPTLITNGQTESPGRSFPTIAVEAFELFLVNRIWPGNRVHARHFRTDLDASRSATVDWAVGAVMALKTAAVMEVGGFDEGYRLYFEETDLAWRLGRKGWTVVTCAEARVVHRSGGSTRRKLSAEHLYLESQYRFYRLAHGLPGVVALWLVQLGGCLFRLALWSMRRAVTPRRAAHLREPFARTARQVGWLLGFRSAYSE